MVSVMVARKFEPVVATLGGGGEGCGPDAAVACARFNHDGADGLIDAKSPGRPRKLSVEQHEELRRLVEAGPDPDRDGVVRWRCVDLCARNWL